MATYGYRDKNKKRTYVAESELTTLKGLPQYIGHYPNPETGKEEARYIRHDLDESTWTPGHKLAKIKVEKPSEIPVQDLTPEEGETIVERDPDDRQRTRDVTLEYNLKHKAYMHPSEVKDFMNKQQMTPQLFAHKPAVITDAIAHPDMKTHITTLGGLAINDFKGDIMASPDLSEHSSPLVKRALNAGLLKPHPLNPTAEPVNYISYDDLDDYGNEFSYQRFDDDKAPYDTVIDRGTARQARNTAMRAFTGRGGAKEQKSVMSTQFDDHVEQLKLPGMD